jgi:hypothetical protein
VSKSENPYSHFSVPTLEAALGEAYRQLSAGKNVSAMIDQMSEALEARQNTDYCEHGNYRYEDYSPSCGLCELGE